MAKRPENSDVPDHGPEEPEDAARYLKAGTGCPFCGSDGNPEAHEFTVLENGVAQNEMGCSECGESWFDIYHLASVFVETTQKHYK